MRELIPTIQSWLAQGKQMALATVVEVQGSSPRPQGAKMLVSSTSEMIGSVSGGCVESAVVDQALQCIKEGLPRLIEYGIDNSSPWSVGLACGGRIKVFIEPIFPDKLPHRFDFIFFSRLIELINSQKTFLIASVISGLKAGEKALCSQDAWILGNPEEGWGKEINTYTAKVMQSDSADTMFLRTHNSAASEIFLEKVSSPARLVVVGAVHIAASLITFARELEFRTIVIDPRSAFLTRDRFPTADDLIHAWPQETLPSINLRQSDCLVVLSHDEKIDVPALKSALASNVGYIGLLGSLKTRQSRFDALTAEGVATQALERIHAPVGLELGASTPSEIALAIMAEIIACKRKTRERH